MICYRVSFDLLSCLLFPYCGPLHALHSHWAGAPIPFSIRLGCQVSPSPSPFLASLFLVVASSFSHSVCVVSCDRPRLPLRLRFVYCCWSILSWPPWFRPSPSVACFLVSMVSFCPAPSSSLEFPRVLRGAPASPRLFWPPRVRRYSARRLCPPCFPYIFAGLALVLFNALFA